LRANDARGGKDEEVRAVSREDDGEESDAVFGGSVAGVDSKHVRGHVRREVVDDRCEFFRENIGSGFGF
jgi:hypothetical protein